MPPVELPTAREVDEGLREHYETHHLWPERAVDASLPAVADHADEAPDERI